MTTCVALLRGINVGGHHKVPMADLRAAFEAYGTNDVATYIQSGNVVFSSDAAEAELAPGLSDHLSDRFGFPIPVVIRTASELGAAAVEHPIAHLGVEEKLLHVAFLAEQPDAAAVAAFDVGPYAPDQLEVRGREAYIAYPAGSGRSKLTLDVVQRALGTTGTARNWRTVQKLVELARAVG
jgi:uncharacterized protein (DUF1697 family)